MATKRSPRNAVFIHLKCSVSCIFIEVAVWISSAAYVTVCIFSCTVLMCILLLIVNSLFITLK